MCQRSSNLHASSTSQTSLSIIKPALYCSRHGHMIKLNWISPSTNVLLSLLITSIPLNGTCCPSRENGSQPNTHAVLILTLIFGTQLDCEENRCIMCTVLLCPALYRWLLFSSHSSYHLTGNFISLYYVYSVIVPCRWLSFSSHSFYFQTGNFVSLYYVYSVIVPCIIQMIIILFTFFLPPDR